MRNFGIALPELHLSELYKNQTQSDSNKLGILINSMKETFALPDFTVVTAEDTQKHKPDPESLTLAIHRLGAEPTSSLVLGDHRVDMQTAVNAGINNRVGIIHGFDDEAALRKYGATQIVGNLSELSKLL